VIETIGTIMTVVGIANQTFKFFKGDDHVPGSVEHLGIGEDHFIAPLFGLLAIAGPSVGLVQKLSNQRAKGSNSTNSIRTGDYDELLQRFAFARINVSMWAHCCRADGKLAEEEDYLTDLMIASLFEEDSLLVGVTNRDLALQELIETFNNPLPVGTIAQIIRSIDIDEITASFYQEACLIVSIDGSVEPVEREFLSNLASEFCISQSDKRSIERQYLRLSQEPPKIDPKYKRESLY
jgi:hypothetical protein